MQISILLNSESNLIKIILLNLAIEGFTEAITTKCFHWFSGQEGGGLM